MVVFTFRISTSCLQILFYSPPHNIDNDTLSLCPTSHLPPVSPDRLVCDRNRLLLEHATVLLFDVFSYLCDLWCFGVIGNGVGSKCGISYPSTMVI